MTGLSHGANLMIARTFPWKSYHTFVDVGDAQGDPAVQVALANPHLRGVGFDLPGSLLARIRFPEGARVGVRAGGRSDAGGCLSCAA
jgi:hypothetical protein